MLRERDAHNSEWNQTKLSWNMEEIVFDFICLADDIIEDLCKDVPVQSNYQRYNIAHALDYESNRWKKTTAAEPCLVPRSRANFMTEVAKKESGKSSNKFGVNIATKSCGESCKRVRDDKSKDSISLDSLDTNREERKGESWDFHCTPNQNELHIDRIEKLKLDPSDPTILNYEVLSLDANGNKAETTGNNNKMKIKIELWRQPDTPTMGAEQKSDLSVESKTTKITVRLPKSVVDTGNQEVVNRYLVDLLKGQLCKGLLVL